MAICWERPVLLDFHLYCFNFSAVIVVDVPFPFGVSGKIWNSIVSVPDHYLLSTFNCRILGRKYAKDVHAMRSNR